MSCSAQFISATVTVIAYRLLEDFIKIMPAEVLMWSWKQHLVEPLLLGAQKPGEQGLVAGPEDPGTGLGSAGAPVASRGPGHFVCAVTYGACALCQVPCPLIRVNTGHVDRVPLRRNDGPTLLGERAF